MSGGFKHDVGFPSFPFAEELYVHPLHGVWGVGLTHYGVRPHEPAERDGCS